MFNVVLWIVGVLVAVQVLKHVLLPLLVWRFFRAPAEWTFELIDPVEFMEGRSPEFLACHSQLRELEFELTSTSMISVPNVTTFFAVYRRPGDTAAAMLMSAMSVRGEQVACDFVQAYADDSHLSVINSPDADGYPSWPRLQMLLLPQHRDLKALYRDFLAIRAADARITRETLPDGSGLDTVSAFLNDQQAWLIGRGILEAGSDGDARRVTLKGAYVLAWRQMWPSKALRRAAHRRRARALLGRPRAAAM